MNSLTGDASISMVATNNTQNSYIDIGYPGDQGKGNLLYSNTANSMLLNTNAAARAHIDISGHLSIGTTAPLSALHVAGNTATTFTTLGVHLGMDPHL
jgi:hypothetical protein